MSSLPQVKNTRGDQQVARNTRAEYVNFFQYPPPILTPRVQNNSNWDDLGLSDPNCPDPVFTVFVSIPYCRVRCHSCPYFRNLLPSGPSFEAPLDEYTETLVQQIRKFGSTVRYSGRRCGSIYFGGGTASLLAPTQLCDLVSALRSAFILSPDAEITLEGNPHEFTGPYLRSIRQVGISRISIGLQSFRQEILKGSLNSPHTADESYVAAEEAVAAGFNTVNIDLLYRVPGQTIDQWQDDVKKTVSFSPDGITIYRYVVHAGSASERLIEDAKLVQQADVMTAHEWYEWARSFLIRHGYEENRKGSFSKPGHLQRYGHLTYDLGTELIGIGAAAYGYSNYRQWISPTSPETYMKRAREGEFPIVERISEKADHRILMERFIIFSFFRFSLDREVFHDLFHDDVLNVFGETFDRLVMEGLVHIDSKAIILTEKGLMQREKVQGAFYQAAPSVRIAAK
jgi:oxygen-independent coproporphyrinogen-3 oxidase